MIFLYIALGVAVLFFAILLGCFIATFFSVRSAHSDPYHIPKGEQYDKYAPIIKAEIKEFLAVPYEDVYVTSYDGKKLHARYYSSGRKNCPVSIFMHGYRANYIRDALGAQKMMNGRGIDVIVCEQRGHGQSEGNTITFGVKESRDCISWINYALERNGKDAEIILMGLSMGAATVLTALGRDDLPKNVKAAIADCPYSTPEDIIRSVLKTMLLPGRLTYKIIRLSARIFGRFDPESVSAKDALSKTDVPVLLIHGTADSLVPYEMSVINRSVCKSPCTLFTVEGAEHGMSYHLDKQGYLEHINKMCDLLDGALTRNSEN